MNKQEVVEDFRRRYEHSFVFLQSSESINNDLFYVDKVLDSEEYTGIMCLRSNKLGHLNINLGSENSVLFPDVPVGVFQYKNAAYICRKNPRKQYRRGICPENTDIREVVQKLIMCDSLISQDIVESAFQKKVNSYKEALFLLQSGRYRSCALSKNFSLSLSLFTESSDNYILYYWSTPVAFIDRNGKITKTFAKILENAIEKIIHE